MRTAPILFAAAIVGIAACSTGAFAQSDTCAGALTIGNGFTNIDTTHATSEGPAEPGCGFASNPNIDNDIWYRYTATCTGMLWVDLCNADFDTRLAVYGPACPATPGTALACDDDSCGMQSRLSLSATAGTTYVIRIGGFSGASGTGTLIITCPPNNDNCDNAADLCTLPTTSIGTLIGATSDGSASCGLSFGTADVWYTFTAPWTTDIFVSTCGTNDTVISLHSGCPGTVDNELDCSDDANICAGQDQGLRRDSSVSRSIGQGQTILIRVTHFGESFPGDFVLNVTMIVPNDTCFGAMNVTDGPTTFCTFGAQTDGPPDCPVNQDVWFAYTASCTGPVRASLCGSNFDTAMAAYTGPCGDLSLVAGGCNDDDGPSCPGSSSSIEFAGTAGNLYYIRVGGAGAATGSGTLSISCGGHCPADWDMSGAVNSADFFAFVLDFFAGNADFNHSGETNSQDFFDFLTAFFAGCP
jgi:hypothetical protein